MATQQKGHQKTILITVLAVFVALLLLLVLPATAARYSYDKLAPLSLELSVINSAKQPIMIDYDYGYGFNEAHMQARQLPASTAPQTIHLTISAWKKIKKIRVRTHDLKIFNLRSVTLQRQGNVVRMLSPAAIGTPLQIAFQVNDVASVFELGGGVNAGQ